MMWPAQGLELWFVRTSLAGGALLALGMVASILIRQPARKQRVVEMALLSCLAVAGLACFPAWWHLDVQPWLLGRSSETAPTALAAEANKSGALADVLAPPEQHDALLQGVSQLDSAEDQAAKLMELNEQQNMLVEYLAKLPLATVNQAPEIESMVLRSQDEGKSGAASIRQWGLVVYFFVVAILFARCLLGYLALARLQRFTVKPPRVAVKMLRDLLQPGQTLPKLGVCSIIQSPICYGLIKPIILLPGSFCEPGREEQMKSVLLHELTHLHRRDAWSCLLATIVQAIYFYQPLIWWLRRQLRLTQEYLADAAAAQVLPAVEYAQCLVDWSVRCGRPSLASRRANGMFQSRSDLTRRVEMLLQKHQPWEAKCPRFWNSLVAGAFIGFGTIVSGMNLSAQELPTVAMAIHDGQADDQKTEQNQRIEVVQWDDQSVSQDRVPLLLAQSRNEDAESKEKMQRELRRLQAQLEQIKRQADDETKKQLESALQQLKRLTEQNANLFIETNKQVQQELLMKRDELAKAKADMVKRLQKSMEENRIRGKAIIDEADAKRQKAEEQLKRTRETLEQLKKQLGEDGQEEWEVLRKRLLERAERAYQEAVAQSENARAKAKEMLAEWEKRLAEMPKQIDRETVERLGKKQTQFELMTPTVPKPPSVSMPQHGIATTTGPTLASGAFIGHRGVLPTHWGVIIETVPESVWSQLNWEEPKGVLVNSVIPNSAAAKAGIKKNDIILTLDDKEVASNLAAFVKLEQALVKEKSGKSISVVVLRKGKKTVISDLELPEKAAGLLNWSYTQQAPVALTTGTPVIPPFRGTVVTTPKSKETLTNTFHFTPGHALNKQGKGVNVTVSSNEGQFKATWQEGDTTLTLTGKKEDGKVHLESILLVEGSVTKKFKALKELDEKHIAKAKKLFEMLQSGTIKVGDDNDD